MINMFKIFFIISLLSNFIFAEIGITAIKTDKIIKNHLFPTDSIWDNIKLTDVIVYPQTTIKFNDKEAKKLNAYNKAKLIKIGAIYNNNGFSIKMSWKDDTYNAQSGLKSDKYPDAFATQIAKFFDNPKKLPYIGMGSKNRPVIVHLHKNIKKHFEPNGYGDVEHQNVINQTNRYSNKDINAFKKKVHESAKTEYTRSFISEGFRSMTEIKDKSSKFRMSMYYNKNTKHWTGIMARKFKDINIDLSKSGAIPIAFAIWDGSKLGRDGLKHLSTWISLNFQGKSGNENLIKELTSEDKGDLVTGKIQVESMCSACHTLNKNKPATPYMAPDLTNIGGYSTNAYLVESIKDPNAVIVPGYNRNAHKNFKWYNVDSQGKRSSTMPVMMTDDKMIENAVKYLRSLKVGQ